MIGCIIFHDEQKLRQIKYHGQYQHYYLNAIINSKRFALNDPDYVVKTRPDASYNLKDLSEWLAEKSTNKNDGNTLYGDSDRTFAGTKDIFVKLKGLNDFFEKQAESPLNGGNSITDG